MTLPPSPPTLKWCTPLPILMLNHSGGDSDWQCSVNTNITSFTDVQPQSIRPELANSSGIFEFIVTTPEFLSFLLLVTTSITGLQVQQYDSLWTEGKKNKNNQNQKKQLLKVSWCFSYSPVNHKGLHLGWTQTSIYLQNIHFTSNHTTSHVFWAYSHSAGTQQGKLHLAGWPILFCGPTQEPCVSHTQHRSQERFWKKCRWLDQKGRNKQKRNPWQWA